MAFVDWNEKHRPVGLSDILGNPSAVREMARWAEEWEDGTPKKRALLLYGSPGTGKTSAALALAYDMGWGVMELNASDVRNAKAIEETATMGAVNETFMPNGEFISTKKGGRKLIVIDEADSLYERGGGEDSGDALDRGGRRAIVEMIKKTKQPIILIVNDIYALTKESAGAQLKWLTTRISFKKVPRTTVTKRLLDIGLQEGVRIEQEAAELIASRTGGDMRAAVNDLQALCAGRTKLLASDVDTMGRRDAQDSIYDLMSSIFGGMSGTSSYRMSMNVDEDPETVILWVDENLPGAYRDPDDLARAYDCLSKADILLARASRNNHYGLWPYAKYMMTGGVAMSKRVRYSSFPRYEFPGWLMAMSRSKGTRGLRRSVVEKIGKATHSSRAEVTNDILPYVSFIFGRDEEFRVSLAYNLRLTNEEISFLWDDEDPEGPMVREVLAGVERMVDKYGEPMVESFSFFRETVDIIPHTKPKDLKAEPIEDESVHHDSKNNKDGDEENEEEDAGAEKQRTLFDF